MEAKKNSPSRKNVSRRQFFKRMGIGSLILVGSGALYLQPWNYPAVPVGFQHLNGMEYTLSQQIGNILFPPNNPLGVSAQDLDLPRRLDEQFNMLDRDNRGQMHLLFYAIEYGTLFSLAFKPFSRLTPEQQIHILGSWEHADSSLRRMMYKGMKLLFSLSYFSHEKVKLAMGYEPRCEGLK